MPPPIGPSSELTHAGRPYELTLLVSTVLVVIVSYAVYTVSKNVYFLFFRIILCIAQAVLWRSV